MARIDLPDGETPEIARVWALTPNLSPAVADLSTAVYEGSQLPARVREAARMRIAQINGCNV
jgi:alkylhydroperoxidase family enzyme